MNRLLRLTLRLRTRCFWTGHRFSGPYRMYNRWAVQCRRCGVYQTIDPEQTWNS